MRWLLQVVVVLNVVSYAWSVIGVFKQHKDMNFLKYRILQVLSIAQWINLIRVVFLVPNSDVNYFIGFVLQLICLVVFWIHSNIVKKNQFTIVFSLDTPTKLVQQGFYRIIRHPFYTTYLFSYFSVAILWMDIIGLSLSLVTLAIYWDAAKTEEGKFLNSPIKEEYSAYKARTGMFLPYL